MSSAVLHGSIEGEKVAATLPRGLSVHSVPSIPRPDSPVFSRSTNTNLPAPEVMLQQQPQYYASQEEEDKEAPLRSSARDLTPRRKKLEEQRCAELLASKFSFDSRLEGCSLDHVATPTSSESPDSSLLSAPSFSSTPSLQLTPMSISPMSLQRRLSLETQIQSPRPRGGMLPHNPLKLLLDAVHVEVERDEYDEEAVSETESEGGNEEDGGVKRTGYNRKEKSLSVLCQNFIRLYGQGNGGSDIGLDSVAQTLEVKRRRIYEIVNVLESLEIVRKKAKNRYTWNGFSSLPHTFARLQAQYGSKFSRSESTEPSCSQASDDSCSLHPSQSSSKETKRREKSLGLLSEKFVVLFLNSESKVVQLHEAAQQLIDPLILEDDKRKTKIKRLYDIANVLVSINLIEKTPINDGFGKKPAYRWIYAQESASSEKKILFFILFKFLIL